MSIVGYYVHHQGTGHLSRAMAIAPHLPGQLTLLGTGIAGRCGEIPYLDLPDDRDAPAQMPMEELPGALHYAPLHCEGIRRRTAMLAGWMARHRPDLLVVDVSVEIAMLARLASTPVLYVRLGGDRGDAAHLEAFRGARFLLAPFHPALDDPATPAWVRAKTRFFPGLTAAMPESAPHPHRILLVLGTGGTALTGADIAAAAAATPLLQWRVIGPLPEITDAPHNLLCLGWVADAAAEIAGAAIIIGAAGDGVVNAVLAAGRPFICLPQSRPYNEQFSKARRLAALGAAIALDTWPPGAAWPELIAQAGQLSPGAQAGLHDPQGLQHAAAFILSQAAR